LYYFSWVLAVMFSICVHEYAHAAVALRLGDDTAAREGHLSLNPFVQMGGSSIFMLLIIGIAWGAVPVNRARLRGRVMGEALVSLAGPLANLALALVFSFLAVSVGRIGGRLGWAAPAGYFFVTASLVNGVLFVFNMLPLPMFDGWNVAGLLVPGLRRVDPRRAQGVGLLVLVLIFISPLGGLVWGLGVEVGRRLIGFWTGILA